MSHYTLRKEKKCLNCGSEVQARYCGKCGQENAEPRETVWHLVTHFFYDFTHFDGKFFTAVRYLLFKPGFLTSEYVKGRRASYLHPIRMYIFTSAFFFLIYFSFISGHTESGKVGVERLKEELQIKEEGLTGLREISAKTGDNALKTAADSAATRFEKAIVLLKDSIKSAEAATQNISSPGNPIPDTVIAGLPRNIRPAMDSINRNLDIEPGENNIEVKLTTIEWYKNEATYLAVQQELPEDKRDGLIVRTLTLKLLRWHSRQEVNGQNPMQVLEDRFKHSFPAILFISLPFFALFLKLLYVRQSRFYYVDHGIFAIHTYCALFILMLLYYLVDGAGAKLHWWVFSVTKTVLLVYMMFYVYKAMQNFYRQRWLPTLGKYVALSVLTAVVMTVLIVFSFIISVYKV